MRKPSCAFSAEITSQVKKSSPAVFSSLSQGNAFLHHAENKIILPLLHPKDHLPFGIALELHRKSIPTQILPSTPQRHRDVFEMHFVLSGYGILTHGKDGITEELGPGDTVLMTSGAATTTACHPSPGRTYHTTTTTNENSQSNEDVAFATLVVYMPRDLLDDLPTEHRTSTTTAGKDLLHQIVQHRWHGSTNRTEFKLSEELIDLILQGAKGIAKSGTRIEAFDSTASSIVSNNTGTSSTSLLLPNDDNIQQSEHDTDNDDMSPTTTNNNTNNNSNTNNNTTSTQSLASTNNNATLELETMKKSLQDMQVFQLPDQTNKLALIFDPYAIPAVPFVFGIEIFEEGHMTVAHIHPAAHEVFFFLSGNGQAQSAPSECSHIDQGDSFPVKAGDIVAFRPGCLHAIHNIGEKKIYCMELMLPHDQFFAEFIRRGELLESLSDDDLCILTRIGCS